MLIVLYISIAILAAWTLVLNFRVRRSSELFDKLSRVKNGSLSDVLTALLKNQTATKKEFEEIYREISRIDKEKSAYIQKFGLVRFSPFGKDEREQSFCLALLDSFGNGFVVTSIHTKELARIYAKDIIRGRSNSDLSAEEKKAIQLALRI